MTNEHPIICEDCGKSIEHNDLNAYHDTEYHVGICGKCREESENQLALRRALDVVIQRGKVYGGPYRNLKQTAELWTAYLGFPVAAHQVAACQILTKLSRLAETPDHDDSVVDIAGYAHCYEDCIKGAKNDRANENSVSSEEPNLQSDSDCGGGSRGA